MKKILSILLAILMVMAIGVSAFAEGTEAYDYEVTGDDSVTVTKYYGEVYQCDVVPNIGGKFVTSIGDSTFENHQLVANIKIGSRVKAIGDYACHNCCNLHFITLPEGLVSIGEYAFQSCVKLEKISLPDGIKELKDGTFMACVALKSVDLPENLEAIGKDAFAICTSLTALEIPASVTTIDNEAFRDCPNLILTVQEGSYAQQFAEENGLEYVSADKAGSEQVAASSR